MADNPAARPHLQWGMDGAHDGDLKKIARYRLDEVLLDEKNVEEALKVLDAKHADAYAGLYADLRGDALAAAGRNDEARAAYQLALAKIDAKTAYRNFVQVKLDSLGGAVANDATPATPAPAAGASAAPAPAPATTPAPAAPAKQP